MAKNFKLSLLLSLLFSSATLFAATGSERAQRQGEDAEPAVKTSATTGLAAQTPERSLGLEGLERPETQRFLQIYSSAGGLKLLTETMERGGPYLAFIRQKVEERAMPIEFLFLPVIESSFVQSASSSSGAVGLWQFMENSMADFKLLLNEWQDDRLDFYRTTEAALAKLTDNYKVLGNWHLALAAYNAGLGAVQRIVSSSGISDYWTLLERGLLKQETASYVPRLLAVAEILLNPRRYGIQCDWTEDPEWTLVETRRQADLSTVARLAGIDGALFQRANMELLRGVTPPGVTYKLKVREKDRDAILAVLNDPSAELLQYYYYTVQYGDTLWALSRHYGVSIETITSANAGLSSANLRPNAVIRIPALNRDLAPYSSIKEEDIPVYTNTYKVKTGDTLWSIARAHGIDMQALALANGISLDTILHAGDSLSVP